MKHWAPWLLWGALVAGCTSSTLIQQEETEESANGDAGELGPSGLGSPGSQASSDEMGVPAADFDDASVPARSGEASASHADASSVMSPDASMKAGATVCSGPQDESSCVAPDALCWDEPGKLAPCSELYDPVCYCLHEPCECWGHFGMDGPPYPDAAATPCDNIRDETTCLQPGAQCWSVHSDVADNCSEYAAPVCDCDDDPCRCWAAELSRLEP